MAGRRRREVARADFSLLSRLTLIRISRSTGRLARMTFQFFFVAVEIDSSVFGRPSANWRIAPSVTDFGGGSDDVPNVKGAGAFSIDPAAATLQQHGLHVFLVCCVAFSRRPSKPVDALRATLEHREKKEKWAKMGARNQEKWGPSTA